MFVKTIKLKQSRQLKKAITIPEYGTKYSNDNVMDTPLVEQAHVLHSNLTGVFGRILFKGKLPEESVCRR